MADNTEWDLPDDPTKEGLEYPNYNITKTASGHEIILDDTKDKESITIRHRMGSTLQLHPDGSVVMISKKGNYQVVFGDNNIMVTGAHNLTVNGPASMKVEGNYDMTVNGDAKHTFNGNVEHVVNGNFTQMVSKDSEVVVAGNQSTKVAGKSEHVAAKMVVASEGNLGLLAGKNLVGSADKAINLTASDGDITQDASDGVKISSDELTHNDINVGDDHMHTEVVKGGDLTGPPEG